MFGYISKKIILSVIIIVFISTTFNIAQSDVTTLPDGVSIYQLDNGLKVMLIEKPSLPMVGINTIVKVGSAFESFSTSGMSHMLEHLLFNGTNTMSQKELYDSTDIIGGYNNANTGEYYTNFMMVTPAENIYEGIKLQAAMLFDSIIPEEKFEKEKGIVLEEIAKSLSKSSTQVENNILPIIYNGHALSFSTLGTYSTIENMSRDDVFKFYKNYYTPNNMIVSVIGNFNSTEMLLKLKEIYGKISPSVVKMSSDNEFATGFNKSKVEENDAVYHRFYSGDKTQLQLFYKIDQPKNLELYELLDFILSEKEDSIKQKLNLQFGEKIEEIKFDIRQSPIRSFIQVTAILNTEEEIGQIKKSLSSLLDEINFEIESGKVETESIKARTRFLKNTEKPHMFGIYNASLFGEYGIEAILASYSGRGYKKAEVELAEFDLAKNCISIIQHPENIEKSEANSNSEEIKLIETDGNSATIIAKQNKGSNLLAIHFLIKNKELLESKYGKDAAKILHDIFGKRMSKPNIQKEISKFGFTFTVNDNPYIPMDNIYLSPEFGYIRVEGLADNVESSIKFLAKQILEFLPTDEEFNLTKGKSKRPSMMGHGNEAKRIFDAKLNSILYKDKVGNIEAPELTYEGLVNFAKEYFISSNMIISVVSPEPSESIKKSLSSFISKSSSNNKLNGYIKEFKEINKSSRTEIAGGGEQSYLYYGFQKQIEETDIAALKVLSLILSDEIIFDIREKQGLAYRMKAGVNLIRNKAMFYINMGTRPENVDKLIPQFANFFNKEILSDISEKTIKKSVNMYLGRMMFRRLSSINQGYYLGHSKYFHTDIFYDSIELNKMKEVTIEDVKSVINKYLKVENPIEIYVK